MGKIIAFANQKGGVGKTTTTVNLAAALGMERKRVLIVDIDPQGNATSGLGINKRSVGKSVYDVIIGECKAIDAVIQTEFRNIDIIPCNISLAGAEIEIIELDKREARLKRAVALIKELYDFILIDCPPSLGLLTLNGLVAADTVMMPIQCEYYALEGLSQLMSTVRQVRKLYNPCLEVEGVLLTMYNSQLNLTMQVENEVKKFFPDKVFKVNIPRNVKIAEAPSYGQPVCYYDKSSKGAVAYSDLASELLKNQKEEVLFDV